MTATTGMEAAEQGLPMPYEMPPRRFAVLYDDVDEDPPVESEVVGWGLQMSDRAVFVWSARADDRAALGVFDSADRVVRMVELSDPVRLVWIDPVAPSR